MTTTPPPEDTTEPRWACGCADDAPGHLDRPSPPAPAAEDDAVAAYTVEERHWKRRAEAAEAEVERLRERVGEVEEDRDDWVQVAGERAGQRDEARQQVADLRALTEGLLTAEAWNSPEVDTVLLIQKRYRALLAGSGDVENPAPSVATSEGRDKAVATSGEQPGPLKAGVMALTGLSSDEVDALGGVREDDRPAPVVPDSADVRDGLPFYIEDGAARVLVFKSGGRRPATASEVAMWDLLAAVGQGVTAEAEVRPCAFCGRRVGPPPKYGYRVHASTCRAVVRSGEQGGE